MSSPPIDFSDYHRTVIGYHGTTTVAAARLVDGADFDPSDQDDVWFGRGVYFWEHAYQQAWWWARRKEAECPAVVGAVIRLGNCFDLLDTGNIANLQSVYKAMVVDMQATGVAVPRNVRSH